MNDLNQARATPAPACAPSVAEGGRNTRFVAAKPRNLAAGGNCRRCGAGEVRAILNRSEPVCGHCIDSMAQLAALSPAVVRAVALDMTPSIECMA